ncbi:MAG: hypothetical protein K9H61_05500 [Bacteroidia bacterium]|nr:hypothetical protein [Bacteroidia bacterium]MCF8446436.1 hypothetical protein [Bacteroidia bacterium]
MNKNNLSSFNAKMNNFSGLIDVVKKFGTAYNPSNTNLSLTALETFLTEGRLANKRVNDAETVYLNAATRRSNLFKDQNQILSRILAILQSEGVDKNLYHDLNQVVKQIKGYSKKQSAPAVIGEPQPNKHTGAYLTLEKRAEDFLQVISFLEMIPNYQPNNTELEITALKAYQLEMEQINDVVATSENALSNERHKRDLLFYNEENGIIVVGRQVKAYIRGSFGRTSSEHLQVIPFKFINRAS